MSESSNNDYIYNQDQFILDNLDNQQVYKGVKRPLTINTGEIDDLYYNCSLTLEQLNCAKETASKVLETDKTDKIYRLKQSIRMREYAENKHLYLDAVYRLLSNADEIPVSYCNENNLTDTDVAKAENIANNSLTGVESLASKLALIAGVELPKSNLFFSKNSNAILYRKLAVHCFEYIYKARLSNA